MIPLTKVTKEKLRVICKAEGRTYDSMINNFCEAYYRGY